MDRCHVPGAFTRKLARRHVQIGCQSHLTSAKTRGKACSSRVHTSIILKQTVVVWSAVLVPSQLCYEGLANCAVHYEHLLKMSNGPLPCCTKAAILFGASFTWRQLEKGLGAYFSGFPGSSETHLEACTYTIHVVDIASDSDGHDMSLVRMKNLASFSGESRFESVDEVCSDYL